jgi:hypothetical protein
MNLSSVWKNRKRAKKAAIRKPKIRWQLLGLTDPKSIDNTSSIETIRREVSSLARHSFGPDTRLRSMPEQSKPVKTRTRRRGATEQTQDSV